MFDEYELEVFREYQERKEKGEFLTNLAHPAPAKLKSECIATFDRRYHKKDDIALRSFFEPRESTEEAFRLAINKCDTDKFRSLNTILNKGRRKTDRKNIELLAWLIDFQLRPYTNWLNEKGRRASETAPPLSNDPPEKEPETKKDNVIITPAANKRSTVRGSRIMVYSLLALLVCAGAYWIWPKRSSPAITTGKADTLSNHETEHGSGKHMYWNNDHYDSIAANPANGAPIVPLDTFRLAHFKQVTDTARITQASIGHIWYFKTPGKGLACFTMGGAYPLDTNRRLLPITAYMIHKYFHH